jgi:hypothetical protein
MNQVAAVGHTMHDSTRFAIEFQNFSVAITPITRAMCAHGRQDHLELSEMLWLSFLAMSPPSDSRQLEHPKHSRFQIGKRHAIDH